MDEKINWDEVYSGDAHWDIQRESKHISILFQALTSNGSVLDAGCGNGRNLSAIAARGYSPFGVDISQQALAKAKVTSPNAMLVCADLERLPFGDRAFDGIYAGYVLQHVDVTQAFAELCRVCKPGGKCLFVVLELTRHNVPCPYDVELSHHELIAALDPFFAICATSQDEYSEVDEYGPHLHQRAIILAETKPMMETK